MIEEIMDLSRQLKVSFIHVKCSANSAADQLTKKGVKRQTLDTITIIFVCLNMCSFWLVAFPLGLFLVFSPLGHWHWVLSLQPLSIFLLYCSVFFIDKISIKKKKKTLFLKGLRDAWEQIHYSHFKSFLSSLTAWPIPHAHPTTNQPKSFNFTPIREIFTTRLKVHFNSMGNISSIRVKLEVTYSQGS